MIAAGRVDIKLGHHNETVRLYTIGDVHLGNGNCALDKAREDVAAIAKDKSARVILQGDLADYIGQADKRWDAATIDPSVRPADLADWGNYLAKQVVKLFRPIRGKIIGALEGNHEATFEARQAQQLHAWTCHELGVRNLGFSCFLDLCFGVAKHETRRRYRLLCHPGAGAAQSPGGKINRLVAFMNFF